MSDPKPETLVLTGDALATALEETFWEEDVAEDAARAASAKTGWGLTDLAEADHVSLEESPGPVFAQGFAAGKRHLLALQRRALEAAGLPRPKGGSDG